MNDLQKLKKQINKIREEKEPIITELQKRIEAQQGIIRTLTNQLLTYQKRVSLNQISGLEKLGLVCTFAGQGNHNKFVIIDVSSLKPEDVFIYNNGARIVSNQELDSFYAIRNEGENKQNISKQLQNFEKEVCNLQLVVGELRLQMNDLKKKYEENVDQQLLSITKQVIDTQHKKYTLSTPEILLQQSLGSYSDQPKLPTIKQEKKSFNFSFAQVSSLSIGEDFVKQKFQNSPDNLRKQHSLPPSTSKQNKQDIDLNDEINKQKELSQKEASKPQPQLQSGDIQAQKEELNKEQQLKAKIVVSDQKQIKQIIVSSNPTQNESNQASNKELQLKLTTFIEIDNKYKDTEAQKIDIEKNAIQQKQVDKPEEKVQIKKSQDDSLKQQVTGKENLVQVVSQIQSSNQMQKVNLQDPNIVEQKLSIEAKQIKSTTQPQKQLHIAVEPDQIEKQAYSKTRPQQVLDQQVFDNVEKHPILIQAEELNSTPDFTPKVEMQISQAPLIESPDDSRGKLDPDMTKIDAARTFQQTSILQHLTDAGENKSQNSQQHAQKSPQNVSLSSAVQSSSVSSAEKSQQIKQQSPIDQKSNFEKLKQNPTDILQLKDKKDIAQTIEIKIQENLQATDKTEKTQLVEIKQQIKEAQSTPISRQQQKGEREKKSQLSGPEHNPSYIESSLKRISQNDQHNPHVVTENQKIGLPVQEDSKINQQKKEKPQSEKTQSIDPNISQPIQSEQQRKIENQVQIDLKNQVQVPKQTSGQKVQQSEFVTPLKLENNNLPSQETPISKLNNSESSPKEIENTVNEFPVQENKGTETEAHQQKQTISSQINEKRIIENKTEEKQQKQTQTKVQINRDESKNKQQQTKQQQQQQQLNKLLIALNQEEEKLRQENKLKELKNSQKDAVNQILQQKKEAPKETSTAHGGNEVYLKAQIKQLFNFGNNTSSVRKSENKYAKTQTQNIQQQTSQLPSQDALIQDNLSKPTVQQSVIQSAQPKTPQTPYSDEHDNFMIISGDYSESSLKSNNPKKKEESNDPVKKTQNQQKKEGLTQELPQKPNETENQINNQELQEKPIQQHKQVEQSHKLGLKLIIKALNFSLRTPDQTDEKTPYPQKGSRKLSQQLSKIQNLSPANNFQVDKQKLVDVDPPKIQLPNEQQKIEEKKKKEKSKTIHFRKR